MSTGCRMVSPEDNIEAKRQEICAKRPKSAKASYPSMHASGPIDPARQPHIMSADKTPRANHQLDVPRHAPFLVFGIRGNRRTVT